MGRARHTPHSFGAHSSITHRSHTIQRSPLQLAQAAKERPDAPSNKNLLPNPMTCHLAVLGWLARRYRGSKGHPWQFVGVAYRTYPPGVGGNHPIVQWMLAHLYGHPNQRVNPPSCVPGVPAAGGYPGHWHSVVSEGDVLYTLNAGQLAHSMVVVRVQSEHAFILAFNNAGTFQPIYPSPPYQYDSTPRDIANPSLWGLRLDNSLGFRALPADAAVPNNARLEMYRVNFSTLAPRLTEMFRHWSYQWSVRGLGWSHDDAHHPPPCVNTCPRGSRSAPLQWERQGGNLI